jgi:hypothetical protein
MTCPLKRDKKGPPEFSEDLSCYIDTLYSLCDQGTTTGGTTAGGATKTMLTGYDGTPLQLFRVKIVDMLR